MVDKTMNSVTGDDINWVLPYERSTIDDCKFAKRVAYLFKKLGTTFVAPLKTNEDHSVRWLCGGSLIWQNFILTAAHCAADDNNVPPDVARMGDINIYSDEDDEFAQQLKIVDIIRHPMHRFSSAYYDIALMKLERNVT
uniref:serine protease snake-like n=1 Tax=Anopheles coluzzii TaxID=1518534 RepID=UPI0020FF83F0|nr:serine protease snake-like [Anopheles coluzzii]